MSARERPDHPAELTLLDYLMDQLPPEASDSIRRHVAACRACRRTIEDLEDTVVALDNLPTVAIPHDTPAAARSALRGRRRRRPVRLAIVAAALLAIAAALAAVGVGRRIGESTQTATTATDADQWFAISLPVGPKKAQAQLASLLHGVAPDAQVVQGQSSRTSPLLVVVVDEAHRTAVARVLHGYTDQAVATNQPYDVEIATTARSPDPTRPRSGSQNPSAIASPTG
jgi:anti-sigma factor RsiW